MYQTYPVQHTSSLGQRHCQYYNDQTNAHQQGHSMYQNYPASHNSSLGHISQQQNRHAVHQMHPVFDDYNQPSSYQQPQQFYNNNNTIYRQGGNVQCIYNTNLQQQFQQGASASQFGKIPVRRSYAPTNRSLLTFI